MRSSFHTIELIPVLHLLKRKEETRPSLKRECKVAQSIER